MDNTDFPNERPVYNFVDNPKMAIYDKKCRYFSTLLEKLILIIRKTYNGEREIVIDIPPIIYIAVLAYHP